MKSSKQHLDAAQRIYDRLGRGSVADIDAIAEALAEAERKEREIIVSALKDELVEIYEDSPDIDIDIECNNLIRRVLDTIPAES